MKAAKAQAAQTNTWSAIADQTVDRRNFLAIMDVDRYDDRSRDFDEIISEEYGIPGAAAVIEGIEGLCRINANRKVIRQKFLVQTPAYQSEYIVEHFRGEASSVRVVARTVVAID